MSNSSSETPLQNDGLNDVPGYPATWDQDTLLQACISHIKTVLDRSGSVLPEKRIRFQVEQDIAFQEVRQRWPRMMGHDRLEAWKKLMETGERMIQEVLPTCVQCGECCRRGSPTLHMEDLELLRQGKIPWQELYVLRRGEPVRAPLKDELFFLLDERIKIREKAGTRQCVFLNPDTESCTIYADRPLQCRAQACWDPDQAQQLTSQPYLTRRDIFAGVELILDIIQEHDQRCAFEKLSAAFKRLEESKGRTVEEVLGLLAYEQHFRGFMAEQMKIPADTVELVFGRSFADLVPVFGFVVKTETDGSRCLMPDNE